MDSRIVIGVTGGIAAYKIPHLVRLLRGKGAEVKVVLTLHAQPLVGSEALRTVSGNPVYTDGTAVHDMDHIRLTEWADVLLIAPATANTIAKIVHGIADNLLTSIAAAFPPSRTIIAPAMNTAMWESSVTRENITLLSGRNFKVLPVGYGELACGEEGAGRMIEVEALVEAVVDHWKKGRPFSGKRVLISSGPTEEPIDPVRVITNRSSGKMGAALAREALRMGAEVTVVSGPAATPLPQGVTVHAVRTAEEMDAALQAEFPKTDVCIMAAAVSDYRPAKAAPHKLHHDRQATLSIDLAANRDILAGLGVVKKQQILVGFALESNDDEARVREKIARKQCDLMVFNRVDTALGTDTTEIAIYGRNGEIQHCGPVSKEAAARELLLRIIELSGKKNE
ncbi:MAG: bifunctional phosphopantothenoylcysteine decarboxylase/phosphopantothenate--cysteine ligase CoaBC [Chitinispirillaceae bacterium]|nr:bifunctional phosphopantothenoylcysteine decarboxylase/phosphopantothenate--cysteine ligase CoaBC [Chitinispirillaceae bacterium]